MQQKKKRITDILSYLQEDVPDAAAVQPDAEDAEEGEQDAEVPPALDVYGKKKLKR